MRQRCWIQIQIRWYRTQVVELCCKGRAVFYVNEFPEKIISEDTIITREPWLFLLNTNAELNQRRLEHFLTVQTLATTDVKPHRWRNASTSRSFIAKSSILLYNLLKESNRGTWSKWKCYLQHSKWLFPSSWNYLIWTTLNRIVLKRKSTKLNHSQMKSVYIIS